MDLKSIKGHIHLNRIWPFTIDIRMPYGKWEKPCFPHFQHQRTAFPDAMVLHHGFSEFLSMHGPCH